MACSAANPELPSSGIHVAAKAPPAISGGTLHVTKSGLAVAADSDRDVVWLADLNTRTVTKVALQEGDEPGRVVEDGAGRVHVGLRGGGAVATIDLASGKVVDRTEVCSAPRGVAYDAATDVIHVACAGGELVTLPAAGGAAVRTLRLDRDLRDVVVKGSNLLVSRFRSAEMLLINGKGQIINRRSPPAFGDDPQNNVTGFGTSFTPTVAWRTVALPSGGAVILHQRSANGVVVVSQPDGYGSSGGGCDGTIVNSTVTSVDDNGDLMNPTAGPSIIGASVPVDIAVDSTGGSYAVVSAGSSSIFFVTSATIDSNAGPLSCVSPDFGNVVEVPIGSRDGSSEIDGTPIAATFWNGTVVVQTRDSGLALVDNGVVSSTLSFKAESVQDTGHYLFHHNASDATALACASCHPEGHEDNHTWVFDNSGSRRTQTVSGGVLHTAPLHWSGDMHDLGMIMHEVFVHRMGGTPQGPLHVDAFGEWINKIPAHPASPSGTKEQIARGKELFFNSEAGCGGCHTGAHFTNNQNHNVGTGEALQVPTLLGVAARAPYFHDGCAPTLHARFDMSLTSCNGGDKHGHISQLSASDVDDLVAYLETL
jgi:hypothetical protein